MLMKVSKLAIDRVFCVQLQAHCGAKRYQIPAMWVEVNSAPTAAMRVVQIRIIFLGWIFSFHQRGPGTVSSSE
jgi:hypothetical protein